MTARRTHIRGVRSPGFTLCNLVIGEGFRQGTEAASPEEATCVRCRGLREINGDLREPPYIDSITFTEAEAEVLITVLKEFEHGCVGATTEALIDKIERPLRRAQGEAVTGFYDDPLAFECPRCGLRMTVTHVDGVVDIFHMKPTCATFDMGDQEYLGEALVLDMEKRAKR